MIDDFKWRYATKAFNPEKALTDNEIELLAESLRLAPSSFGLQPWKFIFVSNPEIKKQLFPFSWGNKQVLDCHTLVVMCAPLEMGDKEVDKFLKLVQSSSSSNGIAKYEAIMKDFLNGMDVPKREQWMSEQIHIALGFLLAAAANLRIDSCPMGGFSAKDYDEILQLNERGLKSVVLCALGHRDNADKYSLAPKTRFTQSEVIEFIKA